MEYVPVGLWRNTNTSFHHTDAIGLVHYSNMYIYAQLEMNLMHIAKRSKQCLKQTRWRYANWPTLTR